MVDEREFRRFLTMPPFSFSGPDVEDLVRKYQFQGRYQGPNGIDIEKLETDMFPSQNVIQKREAYSALHSLFEQLRQSIIQKGGDVMRAFKEIDRDNNGYISEAEMRIAFTNLGIFNLSESQLKQIMERFDENHDGQISYKEFCRQFSDFSQQKAIGDEHPLYPFF